MSPKFEIEVNWITANHGARELRETSGLLRISCEGRVVTRNEDAWSKSVRSDVRVSALPFALWIASNWWRLRWEPGPINYPSDSWRLAHETTSVGYGYVWPHLIVESDGELVDIASRPSSAATPEPIRYLEGSLAHITALEFEESLDAFLSLVLSRLKAVDVHDSGLPELWKEVLSERAHPKISERRKLEARLGYDPDEAPTSLIDSALALGVSVGYDSILEVAPAIAANSDSSDYSAFAAIKGLVEERGIDGQLADIRNTWAAFAAGSQPDFAPWERGQWLAKAFRKSLGVGAGPISNSLLSSILHMPLDVFTKHDSDKKPIGIAVRKDASDKVRVLFRKRNSAGRRFEAARFLADHAFADLQNAWLPSTDSRTARQKAQRAFAAEFLCPISTLEDFLANKITADSVEEAGEYFGVSPLAVRSHLANHGLIPYKAVAT